MTARRPFTFRALNVLYRVRWVAHLGRSKRPGLKGKSNSGDCSDPREPNRTVRITLGLTPREEFRALMHEGLHACFWQVDEDVIDEAAGSLCELLVKAGYGPQGDE